ncbi:glycoside hydrolase family 57 protein [Geomonas propionica]|uniref:Glycoside hydrolase n=1 Tax=Geomonas propionica TaxID=2798582 RepID=A0ABS0YWU6_9BACT|nr:glycoside hydrolase family 57 protein [Geomonas propionica]MBJ6802404.1 glycoside hydrolase [Geomonas propionica]
MSEPLYLTLLWHMHQPFYKDPVRGEYLLPWVYLHAVKDYYDMPAIVADSPGAKVVFNLVPSLLEQILDYASGEAVDPYLSLARKAPAELDSSERLFLLENFFSANKRRMIEPYPRYLELYRMAGDGVPGTVASRAPLFTERDLLDLQVWFYLAWTGEAARRRFPLFGELIRKGRGFDAADKALLFDTQRELISEIVPLYRRLHQEGKVELSVTPYFHPILPLLCDSRIAQVALPGANLPKIDIRYPEDARGQVAHGIESFEKLFGFRPRGMWPAEGSVSDEALEIMAQEGLRWTASDERVLGQTLPGGLDGEREALYHPYLFQQGGEEIALFFRDQVLSDQIGFTYSQWEAERAVADFVGRVKAIRQQCRAPRVISVILDGENAWEHYHDNGLPFLSRLYGALAQMPGVEPATFSEVLERVPERRVLRHVHPGSWINADYGIWIGHPEENLGWEYLAKARQAAVRNSAEVAQLLSGGTSSDEAARRACKALYAAQGSDWFWWYGDDHFSPHSGSFDLLFRSHLINVYQVLALDIPVELHEPIKKQRPAGLVRGPARLITPSLGAAGEDYFEWLSAGLYDLTRQGGAMHAAEPPLQSFFYGYDHEYFYFRIDGVQPLEKLLQPGDRLALHLAGAGEYRIEMQPGEGEGELQLLKEGRWQPSGGVARYWVGRSAQLRIPLPALRLDAGDRLCCYLTHSRGANLLGRWPTEAPLALAYAGPCLGMEPGALKELSPLESKPS